MLLWPQDSWQAAVASDLRSVRALSNLLVYWHPKQACCCDLRVQSCARTWQSSCLLATPSKHAAMASEFRTCAHLVILLSTGTPGGPIRHAAGRGTAGSGFRLRVVRALGYLLVDRKRCILLLGLQGSCCGFEGCLCGICCISRLICSLRTKHSQLTPTNAFV